MWEALAERLKRSAGLKLLVMGVITLVLMIPLMMIAALVDERSDTRDEVSHEISQSWSGRQTLVGPVLVVPFDEERTTADDGPASSVRYGFFLPDELDITGDIEPSTRYRGIYDVTVYTARMQVSGRFGAPDFSAWNVEPERIRWNEAIVALGVTDMRGIKERVVLQWQNEQVAFSSGMQEASRMLPSGMSVRVDAATGAEFALELSLDGSRELQFVPVGQTTTVQLASPWPSPSFNGAFLPDERSVSETGFDAQWQVLDLNRPFGQAWRDNAQDLMSSAFGLALTTPVDHYRKTLRATRYAALVIALTMLAFFLIEMRCRRGAHPFQYFLIGLDLCVFFLLLLALSEHIAFNGAYIAAGIAAVLLAAWYVAAALRSRQLGLITGAVLTGLFGSVYFLLQFEDYALLVGSIGLFAVMVLTMFLTRNFTQLVRAEASD